MNKLKQFFRWIVEENRQCDGYTSAMAVMVVFWAIIILTLLPLLIFLVLATFPYSFAAIPIGIVAWAYRDFSNDFGDE